MIDLACVCKCTVEFHSLVDLVFNIWLLELNVGGGLLVGCEHHALLEEALLIELLLT